MNYAMMVSRRVIAVINSHLHRFTLTRAVKHCGIRRLPFDDKTSTLELVLKQLPRKPSWPGVPPFISVIYIYIVVVFLFKCHIIYIVVV